VITGFLLLMAGIDTLKEQREALSERFLKKQVLPSGSLLHLLLPDRRDNDTINKLRNPKPFLIGARTQLRLRSYDKIYDYDTTMLVNSHPVYYMT